jgi:hypothetical protein
MRKCHAAIEGEIRRRRSGRTIAAGYRVPLLFKIKLMDGRGRATRYTALRARAPAEKNGKTCK